MKYMRTGISLFVAAILASLPAQLATAKAGRPHSTTPSCPLKCPAGYADALYSWELHPERTVYDDAGKTIVPPDATWQVTCALKCQQVAVNKKTLSNSQTKVLCRSGAEPGPFRGPWRITGQFARECSSREAGGCGMHCYDIKKPKPEKKKK
jgi:hypothetical protein